MATKSIQQNKKMNGKLVALAVLLIAVVGGAVVFVSNAGTEVTFTRVAKDMTGGYKDKLYANGTRSATTAIYAPVTKKEIAKTNTVCVHYGVEKEAPANGLGVEVAVLNKSKQQLSAKSTSPSGQGQGDVILVVKSISGEKKGSTNYKCVALTAKNPGTGKVEKLLDDQDVYVRVQMAGRGGILVDKVEGRK